MTDELKRLRDQLVRIESALCDTRPKQAVGEMVVHAITLADAALEAANARIAELSIDLERVRNERNAAQVKARREIHKEYRDRIAELESRLAANGADSARDAERLEWFSRHLSIERLNQYVRYVLQRGGDGDLSDIRTFIDAAIAASAEKEESIRAC